MAPPELGDVSELLARKAGDVNRRDTFEFRFEAGS